MINENTSSNFVNDKIINDLINLIIFAGRHECHRKIEYTLTTINFLCNLDYDNLIELSDNIRSNYDEIIFLGLKKKSISLLLCAIMIDTKKFDEFINGKGNINNIQLSRSVDSELFKIEEKYSKLIVHAKDKNEIQDIILKKNSESIKLFDYNFYDEIVFWFYFGIIQENIFKEPTHSYTEYYNLSNFKINNEILIVEDCEKGKTVLEREYQRQVYGINDVNILFEVKEKYKNDISKLVSKKDFLSGLVEFKKNNSIYINSDEFVTYLGNIFLDTNDLEILKYIFYHYISESKNEKWNYYLDKFNVNKFNYKYEEYSSDLYALRSCYQYCINRYYEKPIDKVYFLTQVFEKESTLFSRVIYLLFQSLLYDYKDKKLFERDLSKLYEIPRINEERKRKNDSYDNISTVFDNNVLKILIEKVICRTKANDIQKKKGIFNFFRK
jgi:hypothetical protein